MPKFIDDPHSKRKLFAKGNRSGGRPKGSLNRLNSLKQELGNASNAKKFLANFSEMLNSDSKRDRFEAVKLVVSILPREDKLQHEIASLVVNKHVIVSACPHCGHNPNDCKGIQTVESDT